MTLGQRVVYKRICSSRTGATCPPRCPPSGRVAMGLSRAAAVWRGADSEMRLPRRLLHRTGGLGRRGCCRNLPSGSPEPGPTIGQQLDSLARRLRGSDRPRRLGSLRSVGAPVGKGARAPGPASTGVQRGPLTRREWLWSWTRGRGGRRRLADGGLAACPRPGGPVIRVYGAGAKGPPPGPDAASRLYLTCATQQGCYTITAFVECYN